MSRQLYLPQNRKDSEKIWERLENDISNVGVVGDASSDFFLDADGNNTTVTKRKWKSDATKQAVLSLIKYEKKKVTNNIENIEIPSAPFAVDKNGISQGNRYDPLVRHQLKGYIQFTDAIEYLKEKDYGQKITDGNDAELIEQKLYYLQKLLNPFKLVYGDQEFTIREAPLKDFETAVAPAKVHVNVKTNAGRQLIIRWDTKGSGKYNVKVFKSDKTEIATITKNFTAEGVSGGIKKVTIPDNVTDTDFYVRVWLLNKEEPKRYFDGPFSCPPNQSAMNPTQTLYDVDKFRLKIDGKYKTIFDLIPLLKDSIDGGMRVINQFTLEQVLQVLRDHIGRLYTINPVGTVKWEHLTLPTAWNVLSNNDKTLIILSHFIDSRLLRDADSVTGFVDSMMYTQLGSNKAAYIPNVRNGGTQRIAGKRKLDKTSSYGPSELEEIFLHEVRVLAAKEKTNNMENVPWKSAMNYLKRYDRVDGRRWDGCCYLETGVEEEACSRLRRLAKMIKLSHERGYPVIDKSVAAPFDYNGSTSTLRYSSFGPNNYDRTQIFPLVQPVPYVMADETVAATSKTEILDPQQSFSKAMLVKNKSMIDVLKNGDGNNYFDHPLYPSKMKKTNNDILEEFEADEVD